MFNGQFFKENKYLEICTGICEFLKNLPKDTIGEDQICFWYTPLFINHVHDQNPFVVEFLLKTGNEIANNEYTSSQKSSQLHTK